jgi:hypothetical protein
MSQLHKTTLNYLINYIPINDKERTLYDKLNKQVLTSYFNDTKRIYFNGTFYLGGQIKMTLDEEITLDKINEVREISKQREIEYRGPCNSWEANSIYTAEIMLNQMEEIIKYHLELSYLREVEN